MTEIKHIDPRALGSITSGFLLLEDFSKVHEAIEWVLGHPVWTHELPSVREIVAPRVKEQFPGMPRGKVHDWKGTADFLLKKYGFAVPVPRGDGARTASPVETLTKMLAEQPSGEGK